MNIINRITGLEWHKSRRWAVRDILSIQKIIIHQELGAADIEHVNRYHIGPNHLSEKGCPHFCYHYGIEKNGGIIQANELSSVTWHTAGQNRLGTGIMLTGNFEGPDNHTGTSEPTSEQMASLKELTEWLMTFLNLTRQDVYGHYHFGKPACPGYVIQQWIEKLRNETDNIHEDTRMEQSMANVQRLLIRSGFDAGPADGIPGTRTMGAIRRFQASRKLVADGVAGPQTWRELLKAGAPETSYTDNK